MKAYLDSWTTWHDVKEAFAINRDEPEHIWAWYDNGGYDGQAIVVFYENDKFYYVTGGHCSCYGLEDQWEPEEYDTKAFLLMLSHDPWEIQGQKKEIARFVKEVITPTREPPPKITMLKDTDNFGIF